MKKVLTLLFVVMISIAATAQYKAPKVIAHRGFHASEGAARNSLNALKAAQEAKIWGSEFDVNLTNDDEAIVIHGPWHHGSAATPKVHVNISKKEEVQAILLANGETVPTLDDYLQQGKKSADTKLIIEIKNQLTPQHESKLIEKVLAKVAEYGLQNNVEYIAFRQHVCDELVKYGPKGIKVAYLNGTLTPEYCKDLGYTGIDYNIGVMQKNPDWIKQSQALGLTVNVWTVNDTERIQWCIDQKVDYITTDNPEEVKRLLGK